MTQHEINRAVADATGEESRVVAEFGFQVEDPPVIVLDPDTLDVYSLDDFQLEDVA